MWDFFEPKERTWYRWDLNGAEVWLHKSGDEWRAGIKAIRFRDLDVRKASALRAGGPKAMRAAPDLPLLVCVAHSPKIALRPVMPLQPFLISARNEVVLLGGQEARFIIDLPVFLRFELESGEFFGEMRPFTLSNTWFGDKTDGILCLSVPTDLDPICKDEDFDASMDRPRLPTLVRSQLLVRNDAHASLDIKLLAVHAELLSVYAAGESLTTDRMRVDGLPDGGLKTSVVRDDDRTETRLLSPARVGQSEFFMRRGVNFLRSIAGL